MIKQDYHILEELSNFNQKTESFFFKRERKEEEGKEKQGEREREANKILKEK